MIGATATSGMVLVSETTGSSPRCRNGSRSIATPTANPSADPSTQPEITAFNTVCTKSRPSVPACS
jgi:hypothetical protein